MLSIIKKGVWKVIQTLPFTRFFYDTRETQTPIRFGMWFMQKIIGYNRDAYWPMHFTSIVGNPKNIYAGIDSSPGYSPGCYIQGGGKVYIGDYTQIAPNVGIISSNHDLHDSRKKIVKEVRIGKYCWIGMNAVVLPGVTVGDFTIIAAGAVITKSFEEGYCVLGGNPARKIKDLEKELCVPFTNEYEYNGYISSIDFKKYRAKKLNI